MLSPGDSGSPVVQHRRKGDRRRAEPIDERCVHSGEEQAGGDGENQRFQGLDEKENEGEGREVWKRRSAEEHGSSSGGGKRGSGFFYQQDVSLKCCRDLIFVFS